MITTETRVIDLTVGELQEILNENIESRISNLKPQQPNDEEELLTIKEASKFLKISVVSIHKWKKQGKIKYLRIGSRIRFRKSEILTALETKKNRRVKP